MSKDNIKWFDSELGKIFISQNPDIPEMAKNIVDSKKRKFEIAINNLVEDNEKKEFIKTEINANRKIVEDATLNHLCDYLTNPDKAKNHLEIYTDKDNSKITFITSLFGYQNIPQLDFGKDVIVKTDLDNIADLVEKLNVFNDNEDNFLLAALKSNNPIKGLVFIISLQQYSSEYLEFLKNKYIELNLESNTVTSENSKEFTTARQVLAIHYLVTQIKKYEKEPKIELSRFIQFLTGKEATIDIKNTNIHKYVKRGLPKSDEQLEKDLIFIRNYFEKLGLYDIVSRINKEIGIKP